MDMEPHEVEELQRKLKKRGFITEAKRDHCEACGQSALHVYRLVGRTGGRDIKWCMNCGAIGSVRRMADDQLVVDEKFDLVKFLE